MFKDNVKKVTIKKIILVTIGFLFLFFISSSAMGIIIEDPAYYYERVVEVSPNNILTVKKGSDDYKPEEIIGEWGENEVIRYGKTETFPGGTKERPTPGVEIIAKSKNNDTNRGGAGYGKIKYNFLPIPNKTGKIVNIGSSQRIPLKITAFGELSISGKHGKYWNAWAKATINGQFVAPWASGGDDFFLFEPSEWTGQTSIVGETSINNSSFNVESNTIYYEKSFSLIYDFSLDPEGFTVDPNQVATVTIDAYADARGHDADARAFVDPIIEIEPGTTFEADGEEYLFSDYFTIEFNPEIGQSAVPLPSAGLLFLPGLVGLVVLRKRFQKD